MKGKILIVEDNVIFQKSLARGLEREGYQIGKAGCGKEAWDLLRVSDFHLILLDIGLPDGNGLDLLEKIREVHSPFSAIVLTGEASPEKEARAKVLGAFAVLTKPIAFQRLKEMIEMAQMKVVG